MTSNVSPSLLKCTYWVCVSACVCVWVWRTSWVSFFRSYLLCFWDRVSCLPGVHQVGWNADQQGLGLHLSQLHATTPGLLCGIWGLNSNLHAWETRTSPAKLSPKCGLCSASLWEIKLGFSRSTALSMKAILGSYWLHFLTYPLNAMTRIPARVSGI